MAEKKSRRNSIRVRVTIFFSIFIITIIVSYVLTYAYFQNINQFQEVIRLANKNRDLIEKLALQANQLYRQKPDVEEFIQRNVNEFDQNLKLLRNGNENPAIPIVEPQAEPVLEQIENSWKQYRNQIDAITKLPAVQLDSVYYTSAQRKLIYERPNEKWGQQLTNLEKTMNQLVRLNEAFINEYLLISEARQTTSNYYLLILLVVNLVSIGVGIYLINRLIFYPLTFITDVAENIANGDLSQKVKFVRNNEVGFVAQAINRMIDKILNATNFIRAIENGQLETNYQSLEDENLEQDTLATALIEMRQQMQIVAEEESDRNWVNKGLSYFSEILQTQYKDSETLATQIVTELVKYVGANQGGIYLADMQEDKEITLNLIATYAYDRVRKKSQQIKVKEGLIGQVYLDGEIIRITDIPDDYFEITSGMGGSQPKNLLIVPLKLNEITLGIMEIASFYDFKDYHISLIERLAENIAATISTTQSNEKTQELLDQSERLRNQMQENEKELKVSLDKYQQAQDEMQKNQEILTAQSVTIQNTLLNFEMDMEERIIDANSLFLNSLGYTFPEVKGEAYKIFMDEEDLRNEYNNLWDQLRDGQSVTDSFKVLAKDESIRWLRGTYSPIRNQEGKPYKVIVLAFDVTAEKIARLDYQEQLNSFKRFNAYVEYDMLARFVDVNEKFLEILEYGREEIINQPQTLIIPKEDIYSIPYQVMWDKLKRGEYHFSEARRITKTGKIVWLQESYNPILDSKGKPYKIVKFITDITERKKAERRILENQMEGMEKEARLIALINNTDDLIWTINQNYKVTLFNNSAEDTYHRWNIKFAQGTDIRATFSPKDSETLSTLYERAMNGERVSKSLLVNKEKAGGDFLNMSLNPIKSEDEEIIGVSVFARNVSNRIKNRLKR